MTFLKIQTIFVLCINFNQIDAGVKQWKYNGQTSRGTFKFIILLGISIPFSKGSVSLISSKLLT